MRFELRTPKSRLIACPHPDDDLVELVVVGDHIAKIDLDRSAILSLTHELLELSAQMGGHLAEDSRR
jgi:hypothetical protein